jgi:hypothetical protein
MMDEKNRVAFPNIMKPEVESTVRFVGEEMKNHDIPVENLVSTLNGFQKVVYYLASVQENIDVGKRFELPKQVRQRYSLRCRIPTPGSYIVPIFLSSSQFEERHVLIMDQLEHFLGGLQKDDMDKIEDIFPGAKVRFRALRDVREFLPKAKDEWTVMFNRGRKVEINLTSDIIRFIDHYLKSEKVLLTITGEIVQVDFDKHTFRLKHSSTNREVRCFYPKLLETKILENRLKLVQVTGDYFLDIEQNPFKVENVSQIVVPDLSAIRIESVEWKNQKLRFRQPLVIPLKYDEETHQLMVAEDSSINLMAFAYTRDELLREINEQVLFMWNKYVKSNREKLAKDALKLRNILSERLEEVEQTV